MLILIPVEGTDEKLAKITTLAGRKHWAVVDFDEGEVRKVTFHDDRMETGYDFIDFIILENKFENYLDFMEEGIMVLVRRQEETIEELVEAFKFKELDEAGI
jgi:predicted Fe-Mo cluster-binding NifX family protein